MAGQPQAGQSDARRSGAGRAADTPSRGRGRPARLSREQIVDASVALVYADPATPLTIKRVAAAVGSAPMALYRYFPDRDDLLHAVADRVAADMRYEPPRGSTWQEQLRAWMLMSMEVLQPYPQLLPYIASTREPSWLPSFVVLVDVLEPLGLDDAELALAIALISTTVVGHTTLAAQRKPIAELAATLTGALQGVDPPHRDRVAPVIAHLPDAMEGLYDTVVANTVAAVEAMAGVRPTVAAGTPRMPLPRVPLAPLFSGTATGA